MIVYVHCGMFVGPAKWQRDHDWVLEPDECCHSFTVEMDAVEYAECGMPIGTKCPKCNSTLDDESHYSEDKP